MIVTRPRVLAALLAPLLAVPALGQPVAAVTPVEAPSAKAAASLVVTSVTNPQARARSGDRITVSTRVTNRGRSTSKASTLRLYLSKDARWDNRDRVLSGSARVKALKRKKSVTVRASAAVPTGVPDGSYRVVACAGTPAASRCRASARTVAIRNQLDARLVGRLTFHDAGQVVEPTRGEAWDRTTNVDVRIEVAGPQGNETFKDDQSGYSLTGVESGHSDNDPCRSDWDTEESGQGGFTWSGDPFTDEIGGHFTRTDRSGVRVWLFQRYNRHTTTVYTGPVERSCRNETTITDIPALDVTSVELVRMAGPGPIRYRVLEWEAEMGMDSRWDTVVGTLTLEQL